MPNAPARRLHRLSKSKLLSWQQCPKKLWLEVHRPKVAAPPKATERMFAIGHDVGRVAQRLERGGVLIGSQEDLTQALADTSAHISARTPVLFEPTFQHGGVLVRGDILKRRQRGYQLREVKAAASVKEHHLADAAIQAWVLRGAGVKLDSVIVQYVDTQFVYPGGGDYRELFAEESVEDEIRPLAREVPKWIAAAQATLAGNEPDRRTGGHCREPYDCPCFAYCSSKEPQVEYPLDILPYSGKTRPRLIEEGYRDVRDIPEGRLKSEDQERIRRVTKSGRPELSPEARKAARAVAHPRYHFDFETVSFAVPIWEGTRPYQQIPFQWSCHIERAAGAIEHRAHLDTTGDPPMEGVARSMVETLGRKGPILAHRASFEKACIETLARLAPKYADSLRRLTPRFVDTLPLAKHYYHPKMMGSWSLKQILPAIAPELDYKDVGEVQEGGQASDAYLEIIAPGTSSERRAELRAALERYCERDTFALVRLMRFLETGK